MLIAQIVNNVEITVAEHYVLFPNTSFSEVGPTPDFMEQHGCYPVTVWKPHDPETEKLVQAEPYLQDGEDFTVQVESLTEQEIEANLNSIAAKVRAQRNQFLKDADWSQGKDISDAVSAPWATYRQQLRDLPDQEGFPKTVTWPTPPGAN